MKNIDFELNLMKWFEMQSIRPIKEYLNNIDKARLMRDSEYAIKWFFKNSAYARANAPNGYSIAAIKSISYLMQINHNLAGLDNVYREFYLGGRNENRNPCFDQRIQSLNFSEIIKDISDGRLESVFNQLKLKGIGHKIRVLFIRDIITITDSEKNFEPNFKNYLYAQPIDTWVRQTMQSLSYKSFKIPNDLIKTPYDINRTEDFEIACKVIDLSLKAKTSPIKVNQGMWYFCSKAVADGGRLKKILKKRNVDAIDNEIKLMDGFIQEL